MMQNNNLKNAINAASVDNELSLAILARNLLQAGIPLEENQLNKKIITELLQNADVDKPETLRKLAEELVLQGYAAKLMAQHSSPINIQPLTIQPTIQSQMPGKGIAIIWEIDRDCDDLNWLIGNQIIADSKIYTVQSLEQELTFPIRKGEKLTLLCTPLPQNPANTPPKTPSTSQS